MKGLFPVARRAGDFLAEVFGLSFYSSIWPRLFRHSGLLPDNLGIGNCSHSLNETLDEFRIS